MDGKYDLLSISIILTILYALSYIASKVGFISKRFHSKIWNTALLLSFLVAGVLGFFLVIQINYKIEISFIEQIILIHVDFGIALFLISVFHILLHLSYFKQLFKTKNKKEIEPLKKDDNPTPRLTESLEKWKLIYSIFVLGLTTIITQILFIREFISVFSGNELLIGIVVSIWLILTGTGALAAYRASLMKSSNTSLTILHLLIGVLPFLSVFILYISKNLVFTVGVQVCYIQQIIFVFFLLLPFCVVSGFAFSYLSKLFSEHYDKQKVYLNYSFESAGSMIGGFLFSFILVLICRTYQILSLLLIINLVAVYLWKSRSLNWFKKSAFLFFGLLAFLTSFLIDFDKISKKYIFPNQEIVLINQSPYGQTIVTENSGQLNIYHNGNYIFSFDTVVSNNSNIAMDEESVHFAMLQQSNPKNVLCISGGLGGSIHEILKYPVQNIDYLEIDNSLSLMAKKYNPDLTNPKVHLLNMDPREYIRHCNKNYDLIFIFLPPPSGTETNRFYTAEFFKMLKAKMSDSACISLGLPSTVNYLDDLALISNRIIYNTLSSCFQQVQVFPGERNYFIASDIAIHTNVVERITSRKIENEYVGYYLDDASITARSNQMVQQIRGTSAINEDLKPMSYLLHIRQQWNIFSGSYRVFGVFLIIISILSFRKFNRYRLGMFAAGYASISAELIIIYLFQMVFGNAYYFTGIVFAVFMLGLVIGPLLPLFQSKYSAKHIFVFSLILLGLSVSALPYLLEIVIENNVAKIVLYSIFFFSTLLIACLTGYAFKQVSMLIPKQAEIIAGELYSADLFGSAYGALITSIVILPLVGLLLSGIPGGILCILSAVVLLRK